MIPRAALALVIGFAAQTAPAPAVADAAARTETKHLTVVTSSPHRPAAPGARVSLWIDVTPKPSMHVYAPEQKDFIPISLRLERHAAVSPQDARFPKAETIFSAASQDTQRVYRKPFRIVQDVTIGGAAGGTLTVKGALRYQACDDAICYAPVTIPVAWTVRLTQPGKATP